MANIDDSGKSALIIGATGQTGGHLLTQLLSSPYFSRVGEYGRRVTPLDKLANVTGKEKLQQKQIDFENLQESGLKDGNWDVVYITLGTMRADAGSAANFEKIDREYVLNAAKAAKCDDPNRKQRLVYLSSGGANKTSPFLYMRSKGLTEDGLASLGYSDTIIFRPGFLQGANRPNGKIRESILSGIFGAISHVTSATSIPISTLGKSIYLAGKLGSEGIPPAVKLTLSGDEGRRFNVIGNLGAFELAKLNN